jgi:hypothetical protein
VAASLAGVGTTTAPVTALLVATSLLLVLCGEDEVISRDGNDQGAKDHAEHESQRIAA